MKRQLAILMAAGLLPMAAVAQEWKVYPYPEAGFSIQFPEAPTVEKAARSRIADQLTYPVRCPAAKDRVHPQHRGLLEHQRRCHEHHR